MRSVVLAGGSARRYGGARKGLLDVGGRRMLDRVVDAVTQATGAPPLLVASDAEAATWRPGLLVVPDVRAGCGSLGGIYTALASGPGAVLCVAWDMPFVTPDFLAALVQASPGFDAFLPESNGPRRMEPLCAVYGPECAAAIERRLDSGELETIGFHPDVKVGRLPLEQVRRYGDPDVLFFNVNSPEELERAEQMAV